MKHLIYKVLLIFLIIFISKYIQITGLKVSAESTGVDYYFFHVPPRTEIVFNQDIKEVSFHVISHKPQSVKIYNRDDRIIGSFFIPETNWDNWAFTGFKVDNTRITLGAEGFQPPGDDRVIAYTIRGALLKLKDGNELYLPADRLSTFLRIDGRYELEKAEKRIKPANRLFHWDANWYRDIVKNGYRYDGNYKKQQNPVFPPIYPVISRLCSLLTKDTEIAMLLTSNLLGLLAVFLIFFITDRSFGQETAFKTAMLYSLYPGALFFTVPYSESTAVLLSSIAFYFLIRRDYYLAFAITGLATIARIQVIFFSMAFAVYFLIRERDDLNLLKLLICCLLSISGILLYSVYLGFKFGEPMAWTLLNRYAWGDGNSLSNFIKNLTSILLFKDISILPNKSYILMIWISIISLIVYLRRYGIKDVLFIVSFIPFIFSVVADISQTYSCDACSDLVRYLYTIFPLFIIFARISNKYIFGLLCGLFALMLFQQSMFFNPHGFITYVP